MPSTSPSLRLRCVTVAAVGQRLGVDRVVVVLARDLDAAGREVAHRMVAAVMTERAA